jgi:hypothetical protein
MQTFIKFSLSAIAIAALVACGGGDTSAENTTPASAPAPSVSTASTGSPAVFLPAGQTSVTYNLNQCQYNSGDRRNISIFDGTATITISNTGVVTYSYSGTTGVAPIAPAFAESWDARTSQNTTFEITRTINGNLYYSFDLDNGGPTISVEYEPSTSPTTRSGTNNVEFRSASNETVTCGYATDPQLTPNFTNYNSRIAQVVAGVTSVTAGNGIASTATLQSGIAQWINGSTSRPTTTYAARLNLATGQLSSNAVASGSFTLFTEFDVASRLNQSSGEVAYKEFVDSSERGFQIYETSTNDGYRFGVNPATPTELQVFQYFD